MARKPRNNKKNAPRNNRKRNMNPKQVALKQALRLKITKKKANHVITRPFGILPVTTTLPGGQMSFTGLTNPPVHWQVFNPLYLPATQQQHDLTDREDLRIYANNCQAEIELYFNKMNIDCCHVRCMYGYYYGLPNMAQSNLLDHTLLETLLPIHSSRLDPANQQTRQFKILSDRTTLMVPKQLYDANWSDDNTSLTEAIFGENPLTEGEEVTHALWTPYKKRFNFRFNRQFTYQNSDPDSIVGGNPFVAIGVFPAGDATQFKSLPFADVGQSYQGKLTYVDDSGVTHNVSVKDTTNPSPALSIKLTTYFKDIQ